MAVEFVALVTFLLRFIGNFSNTSGELLLHSVVGEVGRENYTYYSLMYDGPIALYLHSVSGDADLYVSQLVSRPTFEPDNNCLQSTTCGLDVVHIPSSFSRPIGIGVYGHFSHESSKYLLEVIYREEDKEEEFFGSFEQSEETLDTIEQSSREKENKPESYKKESNLFDRDDEGESFIWTVIWSVFDILLEVVFL